MKQIKDKPLPSSEIIGELTLDDLPLFYPQGRMSKVWLMWETVKRFTRLSDDAHAREILSLNNILKKYETTELKSKDELYHLAELADLDCQTTLSSKILVNASVLHLLSGFVEFVLKELVKLVLPDSPLPEGRACKFKAHLVNPLKAKGILAEFPQGYIENVHNHRDSIRNRFSHGDWEKLAANVGSVSLDNALFGTALFVKELQFKLEEQGYDLRTPTIVRVPHDELPSDAPARSESSREVAADPEQSHPDA